MMKTKRFLGLAGVLASLFLALLASSCRGQVDTAELRAMADELLPRLEVLTGLEARGPIELSWQSRDSMQSFIERQLTEELEPAEIEGTQAAYAAFGLIPDTLDLRRLLLELYGEQIIGYYDPVTKELRVVEGAPRDQLATVLAHELVHALQDQHVDLDSLVSRRGQNDRQMAAQSAFEGQATLVMFALLVEDQLGRSLRPGEMPDMRAQLGAALEAQNSQFPVFRDAPQIIRETMLFAYLGGAAFMQALWRDADRRGESAFPAPIGPLLPSSTRQVIDPEGSFLAERHDPVVLRLSAPPADWRLVYENDLGQLEIGILLKEHLGPGAEVAAERTAGDRYQLLAAPGGGKALVWFTVWEDAAAADRFAASYRRILERRSDRAGRVERIEVGGRPAVLVVDADLSVDPGSVPIPEVAVAES